MPGFAKAPRELVERFDAITADLVGAERRLTFGYPCLYVGGNMVSGLHGSHWFVRLGEAQAAELLAQAGAGPFEVMAGRPMAGYVTLPEAAIADDVAARTWVERAIAFGGTLPPKAPRSAKRT
jgi:TfoX/Sxy family transcriptional regulator of competence genes